jgi:molecular chaperone GrpE (heat shock protein)
MTNTDYNDIVYRLRNPTYWFFQIVGPRSGASVHGESDAPRDAADEIERLRAELAAERERVKALEAEIDNYDALYQGRENKLREALEPFVSGCKAPDLDDFDRARAVLKETGNE